MDRFTRPEIVVFFGATVVLLILALWLAPMTLNIIFPHQDGPTKMEAAMPAPSRVAAPNRSDMDRPRQ
jgi:hypothetical protein